MDLKISEKKEQPLLKRTAVKGLVGFESSTPSRSELRKKVAEALKAAEANVAISSIRTAFGEKKAAFVANIYGSPQDLDRYESVVTLARHGLRQKKVRASKEAPQVKA